jgi:uncharacterized membrane protein
LNDNVTPLRRPQKPKKPAFDVRDPRSQVRLVYGLTIGSFAIMLLGTQFVAWIGMGLGVAALMISVSKRDEGVFWARSHFEFALRTLIIAAVGWTILSILGLVIGIIPFIGKPIIFLAKAAVLVWVAVRSGFGFLRAHDTKVIENPVSWLI